MTILEDDIADLPLNERRRRIFERAVAKYRKAGTPIDDDADFIGLITEWIDGELEMSEVATLASASPRNNRLAADHSDQASSSDSAKPISQGQLLSELDSLIGLHES